MNFYATHYRSGEEIRTGDRVTWAGTPGCVMCVLGSRDVLDDEWESMRGWLEQEYGEGYMLDTELAGLVFEYESDEDLEFVARKP